MATVLVYGHPIGGVGLSITKGIVSRVGFAAYDEHAFGLRLQVDAAINPGNSGGPALVDGKMVGMAFSQLGERSVSAISCPMRRSTRSSKTFETAATTASLHCRVSSNCRCRRTRRFALASG